MQLLYLSAVTKIPNERGEATIERALKRGKGLDGKDEELGIDWYLDNNLRPPSHLTDGAAPEINEEGKIYLPEDQLDFEFLDYILPLKHFLSAKDTLELGCIVKDTLGKKTHVAQMAEEIYDYIYFISRPWYIKLKDDIKYEWNKIFRKKEEREVKDMIINLETKEITEE